MLPLVGNKYRNLRVSQEAGEALDRITAVLERPSANHLADLMIREYAAMVEDPRARRVPKLAVDYDARTQERALLPGVTLLTSALDVAEHFGSPLSMAAEDPPTKKSQGKTGPQAPQTQQRRRGGNAA